MFGHEPQQHHEGRGVTRRAFLTGACATGAVAMVGGLTACATPPQDTGQGDAGGTGSGTNGDAVPGNAAPGKIDKTYDTDLLIVGAGGSGLACAVQAALNGTNFILVDKNNQVGGNASFVEGMFAVNSSLQREQGIEIQPADIVEAELTRGQHRQNGDLWLDLVNKSADNISWCIEQGVTYSGTVDDYYGGLFPTFHWFKDNKAAVGYVEPMKNRLDELGVQLHLKTTVNGLMMKDGKVAGAYASGDEGTLQYNAKAVVFATGGFGGNEEVIAEQGWNTDGMHIVGSPNAAGDGYRLAMDNGARNFMADSAQSILYAIEAFPPIDFHDAAENPINGYFGIAAGGPVLWVNEACQRYSRENLTADNLVLQCIPGKGNKENYVIFDQAIFDQFFGKDDDAKKMFDDALNSNGGGSIYQGDSLETIAGNFNLDADMLKTTVDHYNELCKSGTDSDFGKASDLMVPIETSPFYLAKLSYSYFFSVGGITTDKQRRVLDGDRNPIDGLYAIGNDGNMLYRNVYTINMPGTAFGNQVNSGRESANAVMEYLKQ
ncbi:FAD-dependent oxidoreductase [Eggerthella sinensis]|jgi:fumarate reductase flavoprotein subunit|uniref:FAD-binding dehydrogenase n=1 Tax=Eggerthella sinensis TaxID=242230 RepID=A0A3N0IX96_9ACTN|nr:FAD-dependent oxidoreductase [Eggerthella sinensis]MCB7039245.1 FAD-dependent oxidoreductase [Eggerthella sinensis]RDB65480.1 FAD-binding dehydrogenase [Eggerthella sinensis]RNM41629.1 FAD-binding dehydrogenase [Eggerthella sinensis]